MHVCVCMHVFGRTMGKAPAKVAGTGAVDPFLHIKSLRLSAINLHLTLVIIDGAIVRQFVGATMERYSCAPTSPSPPFSRSVSLCHDASYTQK